MDSILLIGFAIILIIGVVLLTGISRFGRQKTSLDRQYYLKEWQVIEGYRSAGGAALQLAVMEADKLLDHALKARHFRGETMGERLKSARSSFRNNDNIWKAHKLRNRLAHESGIQMNRAWAEQALQSFRAGLKDLGAL